MPDLKLPDKSDIDHCRRCPLWERATQGVTGEGVPTDLMLVGEQPGDDEDRQGRPFVGPAGRLLRQALVSAGVDAENVYITNAVKHFSWEPRGKRRIHKTPAQRDIVACGHWLHREIAAISPKVIVTLGVTALTAVLGHKMSITDARGSTLTIVPGIRVIATYHPSAVLRALDDERRQELHHALVGDLRRAGESSHVEA